MAIGAILILFCLFVFLTVMSTKTWRWFHVTILFFVFIAANFVATIAAVSLRTRSQWQGEYAVKKAALDKLKEEFHLVSQGTNQAADSEAKEILADTIPETMFEVRSKLDELMMYRGTVRRGAEFDTFTKSPDWREVTIKLTKVKNANRLPPPKELPPLQQGGAPRKVATRVSAFKEVLAPNEKAAGPATVKVPVVYMGEFFVVSSGATDVTLKWHFAPSRTQRIHLEKAKGGPSWVLYETLPVDGHQPFSYQIANKIKLDENDPGTPDQNDKPEISPLFGKMDGAQIKQVFAMVVGHTFPRRTRAEMVNLYGPLVSQNYYPNENGRWNEQRNALIQVLITFDPDGVPNADKDPRLSDFFGYPNLSDQTVDRFLEAAIRNYRRDGYRARYTLPPAQSPADPDDLADVWAKVKFKTALKSKAGNRERPELIVDGDENEQMNQFFDVQGRALKGRLRRGEPVEFKKNDLAVFPIGEANSDSFYKDYVKEKLFDTLYYIYVRPLNGYGFHFAKLAREEEYLLGRIRRSQMELMRLNTVVTETRGEIIYREEERGKLNSDLENYRREEGFLKTYETNLTAQELALRREVGEIYQRNQELARQLAEITRRLTLEINERTDAVPPPGIP